MAASRVLRAAIMAIMLALLEPVVICALPFSKPASSSMVRSRYFSIRVDTGAVS